MQTKNNSLLWIAGILLALGILSGNFQPAPIDDTRRPEGPELYTAFSQSPNRIEAASDAKVFGDLVISVAEGLEYDATTTDARIKTGLQVDDLRRWSREYQLKGQSLKGKYPALVEAVKNYLDQHAGTSGGPLDDSKRRAWIKAMKDIGNNAHYASKRLASE